MTIEGQCEQYLKRCLSKQKKKLIFTFKLALECSRANIIDSATTSCVRVYFQINKKKSYIRTSNSQ